MAIFAVVTCDAPICIVSILPVTSSAESTEFDANKSAVINPDDTIPTLLIALSAILAAVIWSSAICIVSILPLTNSAESTEFDASSEAPTAPAAICLATILSVAIFVPSTALSAMFPVAIVFAAISPDTIVPFTIFAEVIELSAKSAFTIVPLTIFEESTELAAR